VVAMIEVSIVWPSRPQFTGFDASTIGFSPDVSPLMKLRRPSPLLLTGRHLLQ